MSKSFHYRKSDVAEAIASVGVKSGDVVFSHSNIGYFGYPESGASLKEAVATILAAFRDVLGAKGTLVVPTFTYSFCRNEPFDPHNTPSTCGVFAEAIRLHNGATRSHDPIFSVAALGSKAAMLTSDAPAACFGPNSFWDRLRQANGMVCNLNLDAGSTYIHYVEKCLNVPYRFDKTFPGIFIENDKPQEREAIFFCRYLDKPETEAAFEPFDAEARTRGLARTKSVGRGAVVGISCKDTYELIADQLKVDPWFLTKANSSVRQLVT